MAESDERYYTRHGEQTMLTDYTNAESENDQRRNFARKTYVNGRVETKNADQSDTSLCQLFANETKKPLDSKEGISDVRNRDAVHTTNIAAHTALKRTPDIEIVSLKSIECQGDDANDSKNIPYQSSVKVSDMVRKHENRAMTAQESDITNEQPNFDPVMEAQDFHHHFIDSDILDTIEEDPEEQHDQNNPMFNHGSNTTGTQSASEATAMCTNDKFAASEVENEYFRFSSPENEPLVQTLYRQDSSENVVIEIKPTHRVESPTTPLLQEQKRSKSVENLSPKDYLVVRANRKLAIQNQEFGATNEDGSLCVVNSLRSGCLGVDNTKRRDGPLSEWKQSDFETENSIHTEFSLGNLNSAFSNVSSKYNEKEKCSNRDSEILQEDNIHQFAKTEHLDTQEDKTQNLSHFFSKRSRASSFGSDQNDAEVAEILKNAEPDGQSDVRLYNMMIVSDKVDSTTDYQTSDDDFRDDVSECAYSDAGDYSTYKTFVLSCDMDNTDQSETETQEYEGETLSEKHDCGPKKRQSSFQTKLVEVEKLLQAMNESIVNEYTDSKSPSTDVGSCDNKEPEESSISLSDTIYVETESKPVSFGTVECTEIKPVSFGTVECTEIKPESFGTVKCTVLPNATLKENKLESIVKSDAVTSHSEDNSNRAPHSEDNTSFSNFDRNGDSSINTMEKGEQADSRKTDTEMKTNAICLATSDSTESRECNSEKDGDNASFNSHDRYSNQPNLMKQSTNFEIDNVIKNTEPITSQIIDISGEKEVITSRESAEHGIMISVPKQEDNGPRETSQNNNFMSNESKYNTNKEEKTLDKRQFRMRRGPLAKRKYIQKCMADKDIKGQHRASLIAKRKTLYRFIHGLNKKKHLPNSDQLQELSYGGEVEDDMIWKLLKDLIKVTGEDLFEEEECDGDQNDDGLLNPEHENMLCCDRKKEKRIDIITYLSPEIGVKSKAKFTPLVSPTRKTLPFNVRELFKTAVNKEKQRSKLRSNIKELKLITGGNVIIRDKHTKEDQGGETVQDSEHKLEKDSGVATQSARPFRMSSAHLVLPKLALIGQQRLPSEVTSPSSQTLISKKDIILNGLDNQGSVVEMGQQEGVSSISLADMLIKAQEMLNSSRLDDAETQLLRLYQQMQEKPEDNTKILVQALIGLADICSRRSRMCRSNPMEWQWLCMHSIALLHYTVEICESEVESLTENQDIEWYQEQKHGAEFKCRPLEDSFNRALYNCLKHEGRKFMDPFRSFSFPNTPTTSQRLGLFPLSTGNNFSVFPGMNYKYSATLQTDQKETVDDTSVGLDWLTKFNQYCNDRLQSKNLGDIYHRIFHKRVRRDYSHNDNDDTESVVSSSADSLDWDHNDLQGIEEMEFEPIAEEPSTVKDQALAFEFSCGDVDDDGWDFFLNDRKGCKFQSVVQVASEKEVPEKLPNRDVQALQQKHHRVKEKEIISPLHEHSIKLTLAKSYSKLADKLITEGDYSKCEILLEQVLKIVDEIQDGSAGLLKFNAQILKNLGTVKSKLGKATEGLEYLNKALETYKDLQDDGANFEIAVALLELGNGYVVGKNNEDGVFDDAIGAVCEFFEKDLSDEQMTSSSSSGKSDATSTHRSPEEEENIEEAIHCYTEALSLLHTFNDEKEMDVVAKATMRLGDCYFMQKDYDRALECFEKALSLFQKTSTLGRELLIDHAHVMCMVGVSTFMLHMYPRAACTFELALHMVKYAFGLNSTFLHGLLLSMMGITFYKMKNYHRCVSVCYQGFEIFCNMHGDKLPTLPKRKFWLVCQILYVMGVSYNNLNLHLKAIKYLTVARTLMMACKMRERRQFMRVLQILGDCYFAQYDYKTALQFYNEALEYGDCESQVSFDEVFDPNSVSDNMTMHNQLVSKSAEAHISMQQYQNAVHYLEQAHDMQEDMGNDIKEDLINTLNQLGQMHSVAGDVDQAIGSFNESVEVYKEIHGDRMGSDMCNILGNLGTMYYVKACICDEIDEELEMILQAEKYFQDAMAIEVNPSVSVKYANFLYSQGNYEDAVLYLDDALKIPDIHNEKDLVYGGLEKVTLPDCLQDEVDCQEEVVLSPTALARYLLILSHKMLGQMNQAERHTMDLLQEVLGSDIPILYSVLGYSLMELALFEEALWSFSTAIDMENEYQLAIDNYNLCLCICLYQMLIKGVENICLFYGLPCYYNL